MLQEKYGLPDKGEREREREREGKRQRWGERKIRRKEEEVTLEELRMKEQGWRQRFEPMYPEFPGSLLTYGL